MNLLVLKNELLNDPLHLGLTNADVTTQCTLLNAYTFSMPRHLMISERGILASYPDGAIVADGVLQKLESFALSAHPLASLIKRVLKFLASGDGIDLGDPATQGMIDYLGGGVITRSEADKLKGIAIRPASRAEILGLGEVTDIHVTAAMEL